MAAAAAWAEAVLDLGPALAGASLKSELADELVLRFRLEPLERRLLDFVVGVERSLRAGRRLLELGGRARLTVGVVATAFGADGEAALGGRGRLREHGLLTVGGLPAGTPGPTDGVGLAPGLAARLAGSAPGIDELGPGIQIVAARDKPTTPEAIATVVREQLVDVAPGWVTVTNAGGGDTRHLAEALSHRLQRPAVVVDGTAVARLAQVWELLAAVRRECDLADAPLFLEAAASVGGAWRALAAPAPHGRPPKPIVLVNADALPARPPAGFVARAVTFVAPTPIEAPPAYEVPAPPAPVPAPPAASAPSLAPSTDPLELARRRAAEDAARAMGKPIPGTDEPIRAAVARSAAAAPAEPQRPSGAATAPPSPATAAPSPEVATRPAEPRVAARRAASRLEDYDEAVDARSAAREAERLARAAVKVEPDASGAAARRRFEELAAKARARARADAVAAGEPARDDAAPTIAPRPAAPVDPNASPESEGPPSPVPEAAAASTAPVVDAAPASAEAAAPDGAPAAAPDTPPDPAEALPFVPVSEESALPDLIRLASTAPNPRQRAELIRRLVVQAPKDVQVLKLLRFLATVPQPLVRAAAEEGLTTIFGPGWSRTRAIPKPAQPPRSD